MTAIKIVQFASLMGLLATFISAGPIEPRQNKPCMHTIGNFAGHNIRLNVNGPMLFANVEGFGADLSNPNAVQLTAGKTPRGFSVMRIEGSGGVGATSYRFILRDHEKCTTHTTTPLGTCHGVYVEDVVEYADGH